MISVKVMITAMAGDWGYRLARDWGLDCDCDGGREGLGWGLGLCCVGARAFRRKDYRSKDFLALW